MGKPDGLSRRSGEEMSGMDTYFFDAGQLLDLENDDLGEEEDAKDVELQGIDMARWEMTNGLWVVPRERRLEVLRQHHDSQVAGHWGRHRTQELVSLNFILDKWPEDVARYVAGCVKCQKSKADRHSRQTRSEEHTSELQSQDRISYAVFCCTSCLSWNVVLYFGKSVCDN